MLNLAALIKPSTPLDYFALLVQQTHEIPLLESAIAIAQDEDDALDIQQFLHTVDQWGNTLKRKLPQDASATYRLQTLNQFFYNRLGFAVNVNNYYAPENSYIHNVINTRRGIPVSLAIIWLELASQIHLKAFGINFPGHFLIKIHVPQGIAIMDPLTGQTLSRLDIEQRLEPFHHTLDKSLDDLYLSNASQRDILIRLLANLKEIYRAKSSWQHLIDIQNRLIILQPKAWHEYRDRGLAHAQLRQNSQALSDLDLYLKNVHLSSDRELIQITRAQLFKQ